MPTAFLIEASPVSLKFGSMHSLRDGPAAMSPPGTTGFDEVVVVDVDTVDVVVVDASVVVEVALGIGATDPVSPPDEEATGPATMRNAESEARVTANSRGRFR